MCATVIAWEGEEVVRDELIKVAERNNVQDLVEAGATVNLMNWSHLLRSGEHQTY